MLTRPLLDPRHFRIDDLLRRPYTPDARFGSSGPHLSAIHPDGWGFANGLRWAGSNGFGLFTLTIRADGEPVMPADAIARPSHLTLHGVSADGQVQVTEDKFISGRDVAVSVVSVRNGGRYDADVQIGLTWHVSDGEQTLGGAPVYVVREAPPGDDLSIRLPAQSHRVLTFVASVASEREAARRAAWAVFEPEEAAFPRRSAHYVLPDANPLLAHVRSYQQWFDRHAPRFDCPDPWLVKLWYHGLHEQRRQEGGLLLPPQSTRNNRLLAGRGKDDALARSRAQFADADFDRPRSDDGARLWPATIVSDVLGLTITDEQITVRPSDWAASWDYFCLEDLALGPHHLTLVWDDPAAPTDAYDDGDKGITVYRNRQAVYHAPSRAPFTLDLAQVGADAVH